MKTQTVENISRFVDGDLSPDELDSLLDQIEQDSDAKSMVGRLYQAKDALHGDLSPHLDDDFASRITASIADEPVVLAPQAASTKTASVSPKKADVIPLRRRWQMPLAGLSVAATVAAVSFFVLQEGTAPSGFTQPEQQIATRVAPQLAPTINPNVTRASAVSGSYWRQVENAATAPATSSVIQREMSDTEKRLNMYLSDHMEYATNRNMQGVLPYSRLVVYETKK